MAWILCGSAGAGAAIATVAPATAVLSAALKWSLRNVAVATADVGAGGGLDADAGGARTPGAPSACSSCKRAFRRFLDACSTADSSKRATAVALPIITAILGGCDRVEVAALTPPRELATAVGNSAAAGASGAADVAADVAPWGDGAAVADATSAAASGVLCKSNIGDNGGIAVVPPPALLVHASKANVTSAVLNAPVAVVVVSSGATVSCRRSVVGAAATDTVAAAVAVRAPPLSSRSPPPPPP